MDYYVARQPIFDLHQAVYAYELLYRSGEANNFYTGTDGDKASLQVITNSVLIIGLDTLTRGRKAFINFTKNLLEQEVATTLPKDFLVVEILENIEPDEKVLESCRKLKDLGYLLALDDFVYDPKYDPFLELADIVKVDFLVTQGDERRKIVERLGHRGIKFLAEKVETREDFAMAQKYGYIYFQGYFFEKPVIVSGKDIPALKHTYIQLLREVNQPTLDIDKVENIIKEEVSLSYKLLRFMNSVAFGFRNEIRSIKQALVLLGPKELSKWVSLITLHSMGADKPDELIVTALSRAHFCELIAQKIGLRSRSSDLFLMGLFSLVHVFLEQPLDQVLADLPVAEEIRGALLGEPGTFRDIFELIISYEQGDWDAIAAKTEKLHLQPQDTIDAYMKSLQLANNIFV